MNYNLKKPCANCPFRTDIKPFIRGERAEEICESIIDSQQSFPCHKTIKHDEEGDGIIGEKSEHCAGAMILLEKLERPNQMMRIAERLGMYDHTKLQMDAPVYDSAEDMIDAHYEADA